MWVFDQMFLSYSCKQNIQMIQIFDLSHVSYVNLFELNFVNIQSFFVPIFIPRPSQMLKNWSIFDVAFPPNHIWLIYRDKEPKGHISPFDLNWSSKLILFSKWITKDGTWLYMDLGDLHFFLNNWYILTWTAARE